MPRKSQPKPAAPQPEPAPTNEPSGESSESEEELEAPQQKPVRRGGDIHAAREKALEKLRERTELKKKEQEIKRIQELTRKELIETELLKQRRDLEEVKSMKQKLAAPKSKPKVKRPPTPSESEESEEEERVPRPSVLDARPTRQRATRRDVEDVMIKRAMEDRLDALRRSFLQQAFS